MPKPVKTVQEITQKQYDQLVTGQKRFYDTLIADGKVRIVKENEPSKPLVETGSKPTGSSQPHLQYQKVSSGRPYQEKPELIARLLNYKVTVLLGNGTVIEGVLKEVTSYELVIDNTIIMKHAVTTVRELEESIDTQTPNQSP